jgi:crotonobetainyl-CoA:carnitine CoA-transferase CaiB-like acyl-CoA transferase
MWRRDNVPPVLEGLAVTTEGAAELPVRVCAGHLALLGAVAVPPDDSVACAISWYGASDGQRNGTEATVQALSGLMAVHGRDRLVPRRLGLEVASVAAGIVAAQGALAALLARRRGLPVRRVETSVLQAALLFLGHHLAIATCGDSFPFRPPAAAPGPPFRTADGYWVELEALSGGAWRAFWTRLGVADGELLGAAWLPFVYRYLAGRCSLPVALHAATRRHTLAALGGAAAECGVAVCRVRSYPELLADPDGTGVGDPDGALNPPWAIGPGERAPSRGGAYSPTVAAPLAGLRVVEVTSRLQGPLAGLLLRMLGAEVIKVEPPGGDFGRSAPPRAGSFGAAYLVYNRGKRPVEIDYKRPEGRAQLTDLAAGADVFLQNWPSGRAERLGLAAADLAARNPGLVYAHAAGWARAADEPAPVAGDYLVQAYAGCGDGLNPADEPAVPSRLTLLDVTGGLLACEGVLAGLCLRERCGRGCRVQTSLSGGAAALQGHVLRAMAAGREAGRRSGRPVWGPLDRPVETVDGYLVIAADDELRRRRLAEICRLALRRGGRADDAALAERLRRRPAAEWERLLAQAAVPAAAVRTDIATLPRDPRVAPALEQEEGGCWVPAAPWQFVT